MRVHVISLERSLARRAALRATLRALGVDHRFSAAIEGRAGYAFFDACDHRQYLLNTGRAPSDGEVGCYASHLRLWQLCATSGQPLIVMEDDAAPDPSFVAALAEARKIIDRYGFIRFEYDGPGQPARTVPRAEAGAFTVHYFLKYPYGAMCYALSPRVARAFVAASRVLRAPVDLFIKRCWEHGQPLYGLLPYAVREGSYAVATTIDARSKEALAANLRAQRALRKIGTAIRRAAFNQRNLHATLTRDEARAR
jgi:glycosyl transferase family 25